MTRGDARQALRQLMALVAFVAMTGFVVGGHGLRSGSPSDVVGTGQDITGLVPEAEPPHVDVDDVVDTVRHRVIPNRGRPDVLVSEDDGYIASFDTTGFELALRGHEGDEAEGLRVSTTGLRRGGRAVPLDPAAWQSDANVASRFLAPGVAERVTASAGRIEWDVVLDAPPLGSGDLVIEAAIAGSGTDPVQQQRALRWAMDEDRAVLMGEMVIRDASGTELHRALPRVDGGVLRLEVPAAVLNRAAYPLTIDPTVSPEYPVSDPTLAAAANGQEAPAIAFDGTNYLVVWQDFRGGIFDIFGTRVSPTGTVLDPTGIVISLANSGQFDPAVAFDGTNYLVVWADRRSVSTDDIYGTRITPGGTVLDVSGIAISTAAGDQESPAVAFDGSDYLVVWTDYRSSLYGDIYGARVSRAGTVLDASGIAISIAVGHQLSPEVAYDGGNFLVVWADHRSGIASDIYANRVSPTGAVLDQAGIPISSAANYQSDPSVAFGGGQYLVVWDDRRSGDSTHIYGARVSAAGVVLDASGIPISVAPISGFDPAVAFDGTTYLVVWTDYRVPTANDIYGARVSAAGAVLDGSGRAISTADSDQSSPVLAFDGTNYLVVWRDVRSGLDIYGARASRAGRVLDGSGLLLSTSADSQYDPAVAFDGTNYLVVWRDLRSGPTADIYAARVSPDGELLDGSGIAVSTASGDQSAPAVAFDGENFLAVWWDTRSGSPDIYGARLSPPGAVLDPGGIPISTAADNQLNPAVAFGDGTYLVVWGDARTGSGDVYGARVDPSGAVLDPTGFDISAEGSGVDPAVDFDGTNHLVVWHDFRSGTAPDIYGARVGPTGAVLDPSGIAISTAGNFQTHPAVDFDGTHHLVVWQDLRSGTSYDIYGARVSKPGAVQDVAGIPISTSPGDQDTPEVAVNGPFLVVWRDRRSVISWDVYGARVTGAGGVQDPGGVVIAGSFREEWQPAVVAGPPGDERFGIAYQRFAPEPIRCKSGVPPDHLHQVIWSCRYERPLARFVEWIGPA